MNLLKSKDLYVLADAFGMELTQSVTSGDILGSCPTVDWTVMGTLKIETSLEVISSFVTPNKCYGILVLVAGDLALLGCSLPTKVANISGQSHVSDVLVIASDLSVVTSSYSVFEDLANECFEQEILDVRDYLNVLRPSYKKVWRTTWGHNNGSGNLGKWKSISLTEMDEVVEKYELVKI